jgi:hypothetical protein
VANVKRLTIDPDLTAARTIDMRHEACVMCVLYH